MDTAQWPREIGLGNTPMVELLPPTTTTATTAAADMPPAPLEKRARPQKEQALNCPRCTSTNTKFCYYNNYSLTQPRYFCKTCRRYWTEGGSLRNVPVGGGSRKNKRSSSSSSSSSSSLTNTTPVSAKPTPPLTPKLIHEGQDLNLAYPHHGSLPEFADFHNKDPSTRRLGPFMQMQMPVYSSGFGMHEFRPPTINFPLDGLNGGGGYGGLHGVQESDGRLLFPFEDLKHADSSNNTEFDQQNRGQGEQNGFWNGMINGGGGPW